MENLTHYPLLVFAVAFVGTVACFSGRLLAAQTQPERGR
jgi:hypothetical protein